MKHITFFFFKQNTAYELRISDWSSDVCSSDLLDHARAVGRDLVAGEGRAVERIEAGVEAEGIGAARAEALVDRADRARVVLDREEPPRGIAPRLVLVADRAATGLAAIGRAPGGDRVCE